MIADWIEPGPDVWEIMYVIDSVIVSNVFSYVVLNVFIFWFPCYKSSAELLRTTNVCSLDGMAE